MEAKAKRKLSKQTKKYILNISIMVIVTAIAMFFIFKDNPSKLYNNKKLLEELKIEIPFIVKLSNALIEEKIIDKIYLDKKELVNHLWK